MLDYDEVMLILSDCDVFDKVKIIRAWQAFLASRLQEANLPSESA